MKNQFFADKRDLLKYDLLLEILDCIPGIQQLTLVPMLTPNDESHHGGFKEYVQGKRREELFQFLHDCVSQGGFDIRRLHSLFDNQRFRYVPYRETEYFSHDHRKEYFSGILDSALRSALVFFDPDNGFEIRSMTRGNGERYILYDEIGEIFQRMDDQSVLVVYQHLARLPRKRIFLDTSERLA